jgi:hypothetical protein
MSDEVEDGAVDVSKHGVAKVGSVAVIALTATHSYPE